MRLEKLITEQLLRRKDEPVVYFSEKWMTGAQLLEMIEANRRQLSEAGFTSGQRLVTLLPNCPALLALAVAVWSLGGALVPLNCRGGKDYLLPALQSLQPWSVVYAQGDEKAVADVEQLPLGQVTLDGPLLSVQGAQQSADSKEYAVFFTTSGTTGLPKSVPLTHENLLANVEGCYHHVHLTPDDVYLWVLPNFHSFGFTLSLLLPQILGGKVAIVANFLPPSDTLKAIAQAGCTVLFLVPAMLEFLKRTANHTPVQIDKVRLVVTGGDRLNLELDKASMALFGVPVLEGYGTTECSPVVAVNRSNEQRKLGTIGTVLSNFDWKVADEQGVEVVQGQPGLLWVKGPCVFDGYYGQPEVTAQRFLDGWYNTGDVVSCDSEGFITVLDRVTDLIIVGGFNVYPQEVERVLNQHPAVASSAVVSQPHKVNGEIPVAFIVPNPDVSVTDRELITYCKGRLANYKVPRMIRFVEQLPLSNTGKILRRKLREMARSGH